MLTAQFIFIYPLFFLWGGSFNLPVFWIINAFTGRHWEIAVITLIVEKENNHTNKGNDDNPENYLISTSNNQFQKHLLTTDPLPVLKHPESDFLVHSRVK